MDLNLGAWNFNLTIVGNSVDPRTGMRGLDVTKVSVRLVTPRRSVSKWG